MLAMRRPHEPLAHLQVTSNTAPIRPLTNRHFSVVQDYVRVSGGNGGGTSDRGHHFYTYNHDIDHPYFAHRPGFVRMKVKNQGLVGTLGDEGKTRLTWLVNTDPGGMIPSAFMNGLLVCLMSTPFIFVEQTEEYLGVREGGDVANLAKSSSTQEEEGKEKGNGAALGSKRESATELKLKSELAEMKAEMTRKDEELRKEKEEHRTVLEGKDEELKNKDEELKNKDEELKNKDVQLKRALLEIAEKEKVNTELRRRLPRAAEEEVSEHAG